MCDSGKHYLCALQMWTQDIHCQIEGAIQTPPVGQSAQDSERLFGDAQINKLFLIIEVLINGILVPGVAWDI